MARYHQALPVLTYFHIGERRAAIEVAIFVLAEALTILAVSDPDTEGIRRPMRVAIGEFIRTSGSHETALEPDAPDLQRLSQAGVSVDPTELDVHLSRNAERRRELHAIARQRGWDWDTGISRGSP